MRCECPKDRVSGWGDEMFGVLDEEEVARNHAVGDCPGTYDLAQYRRGETLLWLCSMCSLASDERIDEGE